MWTTLILAVRLAGELGDGRRSVWRRFVKRPSRLYADAQALKRHTAACRARCSEEDRTRFQLMDGLQAAWIADEKARLKEAEREELGGRVSGPADWRAARQELGLESVRKPNYKCGMPAFVLFGADLPVVRHLSSAESTLAVLGDAKVTDDGIVLTSGSDQTSAVFSDMKLRQTQSFKCDVTFELTAPPGSGEADGIAVVFCREQGVGRGGYGLGYTGLGGEGDFAVEGEYGMDNGLMRRN